MQLLRWARLDKRYGVARPAGIYRTGIRWESFAQEFNSTPFQEWIVDGKQAGEVRSARGLTFLQVDNAGHMV